MHRKTEEVTAKNIQNSKFVQECITKHTGDQQTAFVGNEQSIENATRKNVTKCTADFIPSSKLSTTVPKNQTNMDELQFGDKPNNRFENHNIFVVQAQSGSINFSNESDVLINALETEQKIDAIF